MKKIIAKVKDHAHSSHHSTNDDDGHSEDNGLRASLYEDTSSQAPPRLGTTPIKGDNYEPPSQLHASPLVAAPASASTSAPAHLAASASSYQPQANPQLERQQPVNFSRLPVGRVDPESRKAVGSTQGANSIDGDPSTIQPRDLASPEYSYLSKVYGKGASEPRNQLSARADMGDHSSVEQAILRKKVGTAMSSVDDAYDVTRPPALPPRAAPPQDALATHLHPRSHMDRPEETASASSSSSSEYSRDPTRAPLQPTDRRTVEPPGSSPSNPSTPRDSHARPSLQGIVDLTNTTDTDVVITQAPAVVHETIVPEVHTIREEKIEREIHTYDVFHRIQPIIDVEVLPPRHFIPVEGGGLREVSADEIPGQTGHWGIVETVTKEPPARERPPPPSTAPEKISERTYMTEEGIMRTETTWKHPPTVATGARDTGQSWPLQISQREFEARDGILGTNLPRKQPNTPDSTGALDLKPLEKDLSQATERSRRAQVPDLRVPSSVDPAGSIPEPDAEIDYRTLPSSGRLEPSSTATGAVDSQGDYALPARRAVPGAFPSSTSTATIKTLPPLPPR